MTKKNDRVKIAIGVGVAAAGGLAYYLWSRRVEDAPPPEPPPPGKATLWGIVTDKVTGGRIPGISVNCDGYTGSTDGTGRYEIKNIEPGTYTVYFTDPQGRYEPLTV